MQPLLQQLHFFGLPLWDVLRHGAVRFVCQFVKHGLCYEVSAATMLALHDEPSSKLVRGLAVPKDSTSPEEHSWVEYHCPVAGDIVIDAGWIHASYDTVEHRPSQPSSGRLLYYPEIFWMEKERFYDEYRVDAKHTWSHEEFWNLKFSHQLRQILLDPQQSELLSGLLCAYRPTTDDCSRFHLGMSFLCDDLAMQIGFVRSEFVSLSLPSVLPRALTIAMKASKDLAVKEGRWN